MTTKITVQRQGDSFTVTKTDASGTSSKTLRVSVASTMNMAVLSEGTLPSSTVTIKSEK